ncbi:hypothetical protein H0H92_004644 [Tricholoma furcatifolium]|nr:hypothetical protein H0H92_004644 [Tricholoma furcatifolium]
MNYIDHTLTSYAVNPDLEPSIQAAVTVGEHVLNCYYNKILYPRHKLAYFKEPGWKEDWIQTARELMNEEFKCTYKSLASGNDSDEEHLEQLQNKMNLSTISTLSLNILLIPFSGGLNVAPHILLFQLWHLIMYLSIPGNWAQKGLATDQDFIIKPDTLKNDSSQDIVELVDTD